MENCKAWLEKYKWTIGQISCFYLGKTFIGVVELPNSEKDFSYMPILFISVIFYILAFIMKMYMEGNKLLRQLLWVYLKNFLIWIVSLLSTIFSFSLSHQIGWSMFEIILQTICQIFTTSTLVILCHHSFVSKFEFVAYQCVLAVNVLALGIKTVIFIQYDLDSPHKDMVLLNITTRIAMAILIMDCLQKAYSKSLTTRQSQDTLVEQQMVSR